jgi:uncharacterized protein
MTSTNSETATFSATVTGLNTAAVKGTRLTGTDQVMLDERGAAGDRRFFLIDDRGRMQNGKQLGKLQQIVTTFEEGRLTLAFPDGRIVSAPVEHGDQVTAKFYAHAVTGPLVPGPFSEAISEFVGRQLQLVAAGSAVDRGAAGAVSLVSGGSLRRLAEQGDVDSVDSRRFRMLIEVDGVAAHAEDAWLGVKIEVGEAVLRFDGHVGRCLITARDPDTGQPTLPTLDLLRSYRTDVESTEPLPFGVYGRVLRGGVVRVGDAVMAA